MAKIVVGWREHVSLPEWGVWDLHAKIDTGARSSAIHVENLEETSPGNLRFEVVLSRKYSHKRVLVETKIVRKSPVKNSTGHESERYFVRTTMRLGPVEKEIELSLVNRDNMRVRMLVGRTALGEDFMVDAHATNLLGAVQGGA
ncbi:MAG: ATP-dependent zinc protease [Armatimonadetes bacterium]|nr:ATP-dependent zinc protease [Armatimonadota bacterium]